MDIDKNKLLVTVERLVNLLADRKYNEVEIITDSIRLRAEEIKEAINSYPGDIVPTVVLKGIDVIEINSPIEECWSVNVSLYTNQESPSDLTLGLTLVQSNAKYYKVEIEDIHVL